MCHMRRRIHVSMQVSGETSLVAYEEEDTCVI
jgi:hypothetical protein